MYDTFRNRDEEFKGGKGRKGGRDRCCMAGRKEQNDATTINAKST